MTALVKWIAKLGVLVAIASAVSGCGRTGDFVVTERMGTNYKVFVIEDDDGVRRLRFERDGVDQSAVVPGRPDELVFAYTRGLIAALAMKPDVDKVLIIGLGGGSLPMFLRRHLPNALIDVVDIDPVVLDVARNDLGFLEDERLVVHIDDGRHFVENTTRGPWDLVILDAYGPDEIPLHLATRTFYEAVRQRLTPGGIVAANLWSEDANPRYTSMLRTFERIFPEVHVIAPPNSESRVVIAFASVERFGRDDFLSRTVDLRRRWRLHFDLPAMVRRGYSAPYELPRGGRVLEDSSLP